MASSRMALADERGARYQTLRRALGGQLRTSVVAFPFTLALCLSLTGAGALITIFRPVACETPPRGCLLWSCTQPLAHTADDRWPAEPASVTAAQRTPRDNLDRDAAQRWLALHREQVRSASTADAARVQLAFLGDSITEGWLRTGFSPRAESLPQPECERIWRQTFGRCATVAGYGPFPLPSPTSRPPRPCLLGGIRSTLASAATACRTSVGVSR